jgi:hypothetical protein
MRGPPKFTQIWIFGSKICHLATLVGGKKFVWFVRRHGQMNPFPGILPIVTASPIFPVREEATLVNDILDKMRMWEMLYIGK